MGTNTFNQVAASNDNGPNPNRELLRAAEGGELDKVKFWLDQGADIDTRHTNNDTPLILATREAQTDVVKYLLARQPKSANVALSNNEGATPLHVAARDSATHIAYALIEAGAPLDAQDESGATPAIFGAQTGNFLLLRKLSEKKADLGLADNKGTTPLIQAAKFRQAREAGFLLDKGVAINTSDNSGMTALMHAATQGDAVMICTLLARGANAALKNHKDQTAQDLALDAGHPALATQLEDAVSAVYKAFHHGSEEEVTTMRPLSLKPAGRKP